jgi:hypothetical protein
MPEKLMANGFMADYLELSVRDYTDMVEKDVVFYQANYGDGEWSCIIGKPGGNANGEVYSNELQADLIKTLKEPKFTFFGSNPGWGYKRLEGEVIEWMKKNNIPSIPWMWKETLSAANVHGELGPFMKAFRGKEICAIGPKHFKRLRAFPVKHFIEVPISGAYACMDRTIEKIMQVAHEVDIISFSSGMATNVTMHKLLSSGRDMPTMIDCGALWDPYCDVFSRSSYRKREFLDINMPKNLREATGEEVCPYCGK